MEGISDDLKNKIIKNFPLQPYDIQVDFSLNIYDALSNKKFSIFESPTGTGKSLSMICGSLQWLQDNQQNYDLLSKDNSKNSEENIFQELNLPSWLGNVSKISKENFINNYKLQNESKIQKQKFLQEFINGKNNGKNQKNSDDKKQIQKKQGTGDDDYLLNQADDSGSDGEDFDKDNQNFKSLKNDNQKNQKIKQFGLNQDQFNNKDNDKKNKKDEFPKLKLIYASRTHSQIKQFVNEIKKTRFSKIFTVITLGSRQNLCLNKDVMKLNNIGKINDKCKKKIEKVEDNVPCPYYQNYLENQENFEYLFLTQIQDIEEMKLVGEQHKICAYFQSKQSIANAQIICVPYISLLDKLTRESLGIELKNSIIIFDESHNLLEAVSQVYSKEISYNQLSQVQSALQIYLQKYQKRMKEKNCSYVQQLIDITNLLIEFLANKFKNFNEKNQQNNNKDASQQQNSYEKIRLIEFFLEMNLDQIDIYKIFNFLEKSNIIQKAHFFSLNQYQKQKLNNQNEKNMQNGQNFKGNNERNQNQEGDILNVSELKEFYEERETNQILNFSEFLKVCIESQTEDSLIIIKQSKQLSEMKIKLQNLNCFPHINNLIEESLSVVLAGGTMEPIQEFDLLIDNIGRKHFKKFSCDHIIPKENFQLFIIDSHKDSQQLIYNYQNKDNKKMYENTVDLIFQIIEKIPEGVIFFFQSYKNLEKFKIMIENYKKQVYFNSNNIEPSKQRKQFFYDVQEKQIDLTHYSNLIKEKNNKGCVLFSVIGGKLSEGINFSDGLARAVILIGLPYSNMFSPELQVKMKFYDQRIQSNTNEQQSNLQQQSQQLTGQEYYQNLCMKQINQTIGRCIRHKNDYALIFLIDWRFKQEKIIQKLPKWVQQKVYKNDFNFQKIIPCVDQFFQQKKK